eukprot:Amastigsp_a680660_16.p3 type:complete len:139 gc:universal Amastigsp_a680660_16:594-1010(+)
MRRERKIELWRREQLVRGEARRDEAVLDALNVRESTGHVHVLGLPELRASDGVQSQRRLLRPTMQRRRNLKRPINLGIVLMRREPSTRQLDVVRVQKQRLFPTKLGDPRRHESLQASQKQGRGIDLRVNELHDGRHAG